MPFVKFCERDTSSGGMWLFASATCRKSEGTEAPARKSARRTAAKAQPEKKSAEAKQSGQHRTAEKTSGAKVWSKRDTQKRQLPWVTAAF